MIRFIPFLAFALPLLGDNQTPETTPIETVNTLPFTIEIETAPFTLPTGIQSFSGAVFDGKWIFFAGRTNGLHGFDNVGNNFPPSLQNRIIYIVDPETGSSFSRSLDDPSSGLSSEEIDSLTTTASQSFQREDILFFVGGYGVKSSTGEMETKSTLTRIDLKLLTDWVIHGSPSLKSAIRQLSHPLLQVTGGFLYQENPHTPFLLMLGQNFQGLYRGDSNGTYTEEIRSFWLSDSGNNLYLYPNLKQERRPDYRRRDLNILPILHKNRAAYTALSGVFTLTDGVWTVPIHIEPNGSSIEENPLSSSSFKQGMNNYNTAAFGIYSVKNQEMYAILPGGISFGYFSSGVFTTDSEIPFINQVTAIRIDSERRYTQFLLENEYPVILSTGSNPGNPLLFGAEALFIPEENVPLFYNGVIRLDDLQEERVVIGYIVGGIMSTLPNTNAASDSTASPYVFKITLVRK